MKEERVRASSNKKPARVFMGDTGALALGGLLAAIGAILAPGVLAALLAAVLALGIAAAALGGLRADRLLRILLFALAAAAAREHHGAGDGEQHRQHFFHFRSFPLIPDIA